MSNVGVDRSRISKIFIIVICLAYPLITHRVWGASSLPAQFGIISSYGRQHIFATGRLPPEVQGPTWVGALRDNALHDVMNVIYSAQVNLITGTTGIREADRIHELFPWPYLFLIPLTIYTFVHLRRRVSTGSFSSFDAAIVLMYALFPMASRPLAGMRGLTARSAAAVVLFHLIVVLILVDVSSKRRFGKRRSAVYVVLLVSYFPLHHTWSYYLLTIVGAIGVVGYIRGHDSFKKFAGYGLFIWLVVAVYLVENQILEPTRILVGFASVFGDLQSILRPSSTSDIASAYLYQRNPLYGDLQLVNAVTIILLFVLFGLLLVYRFYHHKTDRVDEGFTAIYGAQTIIAGGLFIWLGITGIRSRIFQISIPISRVLLAHLIITAPSHRFKNVVRTLGVVAICLCLVSLALYPPALSYQISTTEAEAIETVGSHTPTDRAVFSDYRLSTSFMLYGPERIYTVDSRREDPKKTEMLLDNVYYDVQNPSDVLDERISEDSYTVLVTSRQTEVAILDVSLTPFKPANERFMQKWDNTDTFNKVYTNGNATAYSRSKE